MYNESKAKEMLAVMIVDYYDATVDCEWSSEVTRSDIRDCIFRVLMENMESLSDTDTLAALAELNKGNDDDTDAYEYYADLIMVLKYLDTSTQETYRATYQDGVYRLM